MIFKILEAILDSIDKALFKNIRNEYESLVPSYIKLSEGKVGKIEHFRSEDNLLDITVIHTENGPFIRKIEKGRSVLLGDNKTLFWGINTSYTGLRPVIDEYGKERLTFIDDFAFGITEKGHNLSYDFFIGYRVNGTIVTENGIRKDYDEWDCVPVEENQKDNFPVPTGEPFKVAQNIQKDFEKTLEEYSSVQTSGKKIDSDESVFYFP